MYVKWKAKKVIHLYSPVAEIVFVGNTGEQWKQWKQWKWHTVIFHISFCFVQ